MREGGWRGGGRVILSQSLRCGPRSNATRHIASRFMLRCLSRDGVMSTRNFSENGSSCYLVLEDGAKGEVEGRGRGRGGGKG